MARACCNIHRVEHALRLLTSVGLPGIVWQNYRENMVFVKEHGKDDRPNAQ